MNRRAAVRFLAAALCAIGATAANAQLPYGPDTCRQGYVWREAFPGDHVCVTPETRAQAADDNRRAPRPLATRRRRLRPLHLPTGLRLA